MMLNYFGFYMSPVGIPTNKNSPSKDEESLKCQADPLDLVIISSKSRDSDRSSTDLFSVIGKNIIGVYLFIQPQDLLRVVFCHRQTYLLEVTFSDFQVYFKNNSGVYELRKRFFDILKNRRDLYVDIFYRRGNFSKVLEVLTCGS